MKADIRHFEFYGTTNCKSCETGRVTLFIANDECTECNPESYRTKPADTVTVPRIDQETHDLVHRLYSQASWMIDAGLPLDSTRAKLLLEAARKIEDLAALKGERHG